MGIRFQCDACGKKLHVKDFLAGKRAKCPKCNASIEIPTESTIDSTPKIEKPIEAAQPSSQTAQNEPVQPTPAQQKPAQQKPAQPKTKVAAKSAPAPANAANPASAGVAVNEMPPEIPSTPLVNSMTPTVDMPPDMDPDAVLRQGLRMTDSASASSSSSASASSNGLPANSSSVGSTDSNSRMTFASSAAEPKPAPPVPGALDPIEEDPDAVWYVRPPAGGQYGPAAGHLLRRWIEEGRVSPNSLMWREGWEDWLIAAQVFPDLVPSPPDGPRTDAVVSPESMPGSPTPSHEVAKVDESASKVLAYRRKRARSGLWTIIWIVVLSLVLVGLAIVLFLIFMK